VAGFNLYAAFIGVNADLNKACDHFLHFLELDPEGKHIALGGDLDGCDVLPRGFCGIQDYPLLAERLLDCGLDAGMVENIFWNNALEVMRKCSM
jgi:membrane dipeptidase